MTANVGPELTPGLSSATARTGAPRSKLAATSHVNMSHASSRATNRTSSADPLSDRATEALIRRVLLPQHSGDKTREPYVAIHELLPPLTSSNDVDFQLYAFLAIILKEFVQNWYNKITPDEAFVAEVVHVIAHCTRALEQRLRMVDLEALLFNEVPEILDRHVSSEWHRQVAFILANARGSISMFTPAPGINPCCNGPPPGCISFAVAYTVHDASSRFPI